jgi:hypothetical protein
MAQSVLRILSLTALGGFAALGGLAACERPSEDLSGVWKTTTGVMTLRQTGDEVVGRYETPDGAFHGVRRGDVVSGVWTQASANRDCGEERDGSRFWGGFVWRLRPDGRRFAGSWAYCDDKPEFASGGVWVGERMGRAP